MRMLWLGIWLLAVNPAMAEIYRCPQGKTTVFSDKPCDASAEAYEPKTPLIVVPHEKAPDLAKQYDARIAQEKKAIKEENTDWNKQYKAKRAEEERLRAARVKGKVVQGMQAEEVLRLMGDPTEISRDEDRSNTHETWTYLVGREKTQIYFKDGVVSRTYHKKLRR